MALQSPNYNSSLVERYNTELYDNERLLQQIQKKTAAICFCDNVDKIYTFTGSVTVQKAHNSCVCTSPSRHRIGLNVCVCSWSVFGWQKDNVTFQDIICPTCCYRLGEIANSNGNRVEWASPRDTQTPFACYGLDLLAMKDVALWLHNFQHNNKISTLCRSVELTWAERCVSSKLVFTAWPHCLQWRAL